MKHEHAYYVCFEYRNGYRGIIGPLTRDYCAKVLRRFYRDNQQKKRENKEHPSHPGTYGWWYYNIHVETYATNNGVANTSNIDGEWNLFGSAVL